jgi:deoxyuridine 5'-triphosphate nucleotidohydrolase
MSAYLYGFNFNKQLLERKTNSQPVDNFSLYTLINNDKLEFIRGFTDSFFNYYKKKFHTKNRLPISFSSFFLKYYKHSFIVFSENKSVLDFILSVIPNGNIYMYGNIYYLKYSANNALDFLHTLYRQTKERDIKSSFQIIYSKFCLSEEKTNIDSFLFVKTDPMACDPEKVRASDSGYDLTLLRKIKTVGNVEFYDTCIQVEPPFGYYFDLVGRSSISKSGYILANSFGVIDRTYRGNIIVPLIKIDKNANDLILPNRLVQIIPRHIIHLHPLEINDRDLQLTERNAGGFGSTGK